MFITTISKVYEYLKKHISLIEVVSLVLFIVFMPLISKVNFMQNDDWNRTTSVVRFLLGDFSLIQKTATTFYSQGLIGYLFSLVFGWKRLPFLTLLFSVLNFYIFARILSDHLKLSKVKAALISLILFFTPLHIYSAIGFMTENYTLFFILLSIYFFLSYEKTSEIKHLVLFDLGGLLAFFSKQNGIIVQVASIPYFIFKKKYKEALGQLGFIFLTFGYYYLLFPRTDEMHDKDFIFGNVINTQYSYSLVYGMLLVLSSFILPILVHFVLSTYLDLKEKLGEKRLKTVLILLVAFSLCFIFLNKWFTPGKISWEEYPYFENTFERTGFFPRSIAGTKYQFRWNYDLFRYWDLCSKILLSLALPCLFFYRKKIINIYSISIVGYIFLMIFVKSFFDRYLLPLIPLAILFFLTLKPVEVKLEKVFLTLTLTFVVFIGLFSSQMAVDFVLTNNYIWSKSESLVKQGVNAKQVKSTMAWGKLYEISGDTKYLFSFDDYIKNPILKETYVLEEKKELKFFGSVFINPVVYLYKKIQ